MIIYDTYSCSNHYEIHQYQDESNPDNYFGLIN